MELCCSLLVESKPQYLHVGFVDGRRVQFFSSYQNLLGEAKLRDVEEGRWLDDGGKSNV